MKKLKKALDKNLKEITTPKPEDEPENEDDPDSVQVDVDPKKKKNSPKSAKLQEDPNSKEQPEFAEPQKDDDEQDPNNKNNQNDAKHFYDEDYE